jgi:hypothetical protein
MKFKQQLMQLLGGLGAVGVWYADTKHLLVKQALPLAAYALPVAIALGVDIKKLMGVLLKGTKMEGLLDTEKKIDVSSELVALAVTNKVRLQEVHNALELGLSEAVISSMIKADAPAFRLQFDKK